MKRKRYWEIDAVRGAAVAGMVMYHLLVDIEIIFLIPIGVYKIPLLLFARTVATVFILLLGISAAIKFERIRGDGVRRVGLSFGKRALQIGLGAVAISIVTYFMFPNDFIFFGILHFMAVALVLMVPFLYLGKNLLLTTVAVLIIILSFVKQSLFKLNFSSLDYFPLLPWFGIVILGIVIGRIVKFDKKYKTNLLTRIGHKSLLIYLLHQPILWGTLWAVKTIIRQ